MMQSAMRSGGFLSGSSKGQHPGRATEGSNNELYFDLWGSVGCCRPDSGNSGAWRGACDQVLRASGALVQGPTTRSMTSTPSGFSNSNVSGAGAWLIRMSEKEIEVSLPNKSTRRVSRISPVATLARSPRVS